jgi:hypothetical protein
MKNLLTYENFLLLEKNKTVQFFKDNPQLLSSFSKGIQSHSKAKWDPKRFNSIDRDKELERESNAKSILRKKLEKIDGVNELVDPTNKNSWTVLEILSGNRIGYSDWWDWRRLKDDILNAKTVEQFLKDNNSARSRSWRLPFEDYSTAKDLSEYENFYKVISKNFDLIYKNMKWIDTALVGIKGSSDEGFRNELSKMGISYQDLMVAMSYIEDWTSMSRKKLDPSVWPLLQKISVDPSSLPKVIYRGIFIDGVKIKDEAAFLKKWYVGSSPGASQGKATSWSVDRGTAASFMIDQDFIKDRAKGYYVLLKWTVDPAKVIADLRNLPVDHRYWNQQEIIVNPSARDYEVDTIIPGSSGNESHREFVNSIKGGQGAWGKSKAEFAMNFINTPYETLNPNQRMEFKRITKMTVGEFISEYPSSNFNYNLSEWKDVPMPIWNYVDKYTSNLRLISASDSKIEFVFEINLSDLYYINDPRIKSVYERVKKETDFNQFAGYHSLFSDKGTIELIDNNFYDVNILIKMPTVIKIAPNKENKGESRKLDIEADDALKKIFDEVGSDTLLELIIKEQSKRNPPRNINVQIK